MDSIPKYVDFQQFLQTIEVNSPNLAAIINNYYNQLVNENAQLDASLSVKAKQFVEKVRLELYNSK